MLKQTILEHEKSLLDAPSRNSRTHLTKILADDFMEFGSSGKQYNKADIIAWLETEEKFEYDLSDFIVAVLAEGVVLATYKIVINGKGSLRSSIWRKGGDRWQMFFHQGTLSE